jgi:hypothetical protein
LLKKSPKEALKSQNQLKKPNKYITGFVGLKPNGTETGWFK